MASQPPRKIRVGPHTYRVTLIDTALPDAGCDGICSKDRLTIGLYSEQGPSKLADTLLHELCHAMLATVDFGDQQPLEEAVCLALGPALLQVVRDNPKLIAYLTE